MAGIPKEQWPQLLGVMAHPTRMMILTELAEGMKCVGDIQELLAVPQPNVSQHLAILKKSGLVVSHKAGVSRCYCLAKPGLVRDLFAVLNRDYSPSGTQRPAACRTVKRKPRRRTGNGRRRQAVPGG